MKLINGEENTVYEIPEWERDGEMKRQLLGV